MNNTHRQFVCLPHIIAFNRLKIKYTDVAVYVALRSYNNLYSTCYPSYETIAKRAKCTRGYVIQAIKRLESANLIVVKRSKEAKKSNRYTFQDHYMFERIPYEIFDVDLNLYDLAMLLSIRQFFYGGRLQPFEGIRFISDKLGVSYKVAHQRISSLMKKGYVTKNTNSRGCKYMLTDKVKWIYDYNGIYNKETNIYQKLIVI